MPPGVRATIGKRTGYAPAPEIHRLALWPRKATVLDLDDPEPDRRPAPTSHPPLRLADGALSRSSHGAPLEPAAWRSRRRGDRSDSARRAWPHGWEVP
jgi:hypothetical protein